MPEKFRVLQTYGLLQTVRPQVERVLAKHLKFPKATETFVSNGGHMIGIAKGNHLIGLCLYLPVRPDWNMISFIWTDARSRLAKEFKAEKGDTPARFMLHEFIQDGVRFFSHNGYTPQGKAFIETLERTRHTEKVGENLFAVKPSAQKAIAPSRAKRIRTVVH